MFFQRVFQNISKLGASTFLIPSAQSQSGALFHLLKGHSTKRHYCHKNHPNNIIEKLYPDRSGFLSPFAGGNITQNPNTVLKLIGAPRMSLVGASSASCKRHFASSGRSGWNDFYHRGADFAYKGVTSLLILVTLVSSMKITFDLVLSMRTKKQRHAEGVQLMDEIGSRLDSIAAPRIVEMHQEQLKKDEQKKEVDEKQRQALEIAKGLIDKK